MKTFTPTNRTLTHTSAPTSALMLTVALTFGATAAFAQTDSAAEAAPATSAETDVGTAADTYTGEPSVTAPDAGSETTTETATEADSAPKSEADLAVGISKQMPTAEVETPNGPVTIKRIQDTDNRLQGEWARTSRPCPDFCIQPMTPAEGVTTIGELELIAMLQDPDAVVVDSRTVDWFQGGTIPGAVSIPYTQVVDELATLGCEADFDGWDCANAKPVALFCNGIWCGQSPTAIRNMVEEGYPADRIFYYRGGMQVWRTLGLTVTGDK